MRNVINLLPEEMDVAYVEANPNMHRYNFERQDTYDAYNELWNDAVAELTGRFVEYLNNNEDKIQDTYKALRKKYGNKHALKGWQWGPVNNTVYCGGGIKFVSCTGHGGFLVSHAREAGIDAELQRGGTYEEDCDFMIVAAYYPDAAVKFNPDYFTDREHARKVAAESVVRWSYGAVKNILDRQ